MMRKISICDKFSTRDFFVYKPDKFKMHVIVFFAGDVDDDDEEIWRGNETRDFNY